MPEDLIHMSLIGSYCILLILPARVLLSRCGRKYACCLWAAVFWNLVIPFDLRGGFSLFPGQMGDLFFAAQSAESESIVVYADDTETVFLSDGEKTPPGSGAAVRQSTDRADSFYLPVSAKPGRMWNAEALWRRLPDILRVIWLPGFSMILLYHLAYTVRTQRRISRDRWKSWDKENRVAVVEGLPSPFLWGIFRPVIFLPAGLEEEE